MTDAAALLAAIRQSPDDDAPRLVYADWLDEHGQSERAEFIRVQCELARAETPALRRREAELLAAHHDAFAGPLAAPHLRFRFERGFIVAFGHSGLFHQPRRRQMRVQVNDYLSFRPDGLVVSCVSVVQPVDAIELFQMGHLPAGLYRLDVFECPVMIGFRLKVKDQAPLYLGILDRTQIRVRVQVRTEDKGPEHRYTHIHLAGFHSFPET